MLTIFLALQLSLFGGARNIHQTHTPTGGGGGGSYSPTSTIFNGSAALTNTMSVSDGKKFTLSFWVKFDASGDGTSQELFLGTDLVIAGKVDVRRLSSNFLNVQLRNSAGTVIYGSQTTGTYTSANGWIHVLMACDLATSSSTLKINGTSDNDNYAGTDDTINYAEPTAWFIGQQYDGSVRFAGKLSEFYFNSSANITDNTKFESGGHPISLGSDGSTVTGSQPDVYLNNPYSSFQTNKGSKGNFVVIGTLGDGGGDVP